MPAHRRSVARRRFAALAALGALALIVGLAIGAGRGGDEPARERAPTAPSAARGGPEAPLAQAQRLPLERRLGQLLVMSFDGAAAPDYILRRLRTGEGTGVILFAKNAPDEAALRALTGRIQRAAAGAALVATDQEGGDIRTMPFLPPEPSQGRLSSVAAVTPTAREAARHLRAAGVNVNLAPVADVTDSLRSVVAGRAFPGGGREVSALTSASVRAHKRERVATTAKHFPGLGRATANTDDTSVSIPASREQLLGTDLLPFEAAVGAGAPLVMSSHALYPALDRERIASQSPRVLRDLLRGRLDFDGAVVTDSIEAQAVLDRSDVGVAAERSVEAGNDLILMTGSGSFNQVQPRLLARARRDARFRLRVTQAADRVLKLKRELGLRAPP